ncbi:MAG: TraX family protein [Aristaeellaceae bacterium]
MREDKAIAGNTATGTLKVLALALMFADHAGKMLFPGVMELRMLGRAAFPVYCWCMVVGFCHTRSVPKYLLRVLAVGLVSQPLYVLALNHTWREPNIFLTLLLALCGLWAIREKKAFSHLWAPPLLLILASRLGCDYGWRGVMLVWLLYAVRDSRPGIAAVMVAFCMYWGSASITISQLFGWRIVLPDLLSPVLSPWTRLQAWAILALPLMLVRFKRSIRLPAWAGYALYPAHLAVLYLLEVCL